MTIGSLWPHITHEVKWVSSRIEKSVLDERLSFISLKQRALDQDFNFFSNFVIIFFGVPQPPSPNQ